MRRTAVLLVCLLALAGCSSGKSYDDTVKDCVSALKARPAGDKSKPKACDGVKEDDYTTLVMGLTLDDMGVVDEDGNVDMDKLLDEATATP
ncbi:hypothetical protein [Streptomyces griseorubiginosus]|uniref:hypothetical protein n=1 Tax=Streptomyces griseorubiginosus TaxID=67304 RepID=UPI0036E09BD1